MRSDRLDALLHPMRPAYLAEAASVLLLKMLDKRRREYKRVGWVYAARNPSFAESVFKIGQTTVGPSKRVAQLSASTSVYGEFQLVYFVHVSDHLRAEQFVHHKLRDSRLKSGKEFFGASIMTVVKVLDEAGEIWGIPVDPAPGAGPLPPALTKSVVQCPECSSKSRVPQLLIDVSVRCPRCRAPYTVRGGQWSAPDGPPGIPVPDSVQVPWSGKESQ